MTAPSYELHTRFAYNTANSQKPSAYPSVLGTQISSDKTSMLPEICLSHPNTLSSSTNAHLYSLMKHQLAFLLARAQVPIEWPQLPSENADGDADINFQDKLPEDLLECLSNSKLGVDSKEFGKEVGVADVKSLKDVYKSHLENTSE